MRATVAELNEQVPLLVGRVADWRCSWAGTPSIWPPRSPRQTTACVAPPRPVTQEQRSGNPSTTRRPDPFSALYPEAPNIPESGPNASSEANRRPKRGARMTTMGGLGTPSWEATVQRRPLQGERPARGVAIIGGHPAPGPRPPGRLSRGAAASARPGRRGRAGGGAWPRGRGACRGTGTRRPRRARPGPGRP